VISLLVMCKSINHTMIRSHARITALTLLLGCELGIDESLLPDLGKSAFLYRIGTYVLEFRQNSSQAGTANAANTAGASSTGSTSGSVGVHGPSSGSVVESAKANVEEMANSSNMEQLTRVKAGFALLKKRFNEKIARCAFDQYERLDGSGLMHKPGNEISLWSKIIAVAEKFVESSDNSTNKKSNAQVALDSISSNTGTLYDPIVVDLLRKFIFPYQLGAIIDLFDGSVGIIVKNGSAPDFLPMFKIITSRDPSLYQDGDFIDMSQNKEIMIRKIRTD
jgi:hypothetical protein